MLEEEVFRLPYRAAHRAADRVGVGRDVHHHRHDALEFVDFPVVGEVILRRWLHDSHVDAIADVLQPLDIDWFRAPAIGIVRG